MASAIDGKGLLEAKQAAEKALGEKLHFMLKMKADLERK